MFGKIFLALAVAVVIMATVHIGSVDAHERPPDTPAQAIVRKCIEDAEKAVAQASIPRINFECLSIRTGISVELLESHGTPPGF